MAEPTPKPPPDPVLDGLKSLSQTALSIYALPRQLASLNVSRQILLPLLLEGTRVLGERLAELERACKAELAQERPSPQAESAVLAPKK